MRRNGTYGGTWAVRMFVAAMTGVADSAVILNLMSRQLAGKAMQKHQAWTRWYQYWCMSSATDAPPHLLLLPHADRDVPRAGQGPAVLHRLRHYLVRPHSGILLALEAVFMGMCMFLCRFLGLPQEFVVPPPLQPLDIQLPDAQAGAVQ